MTYSQHFNSLIRYMYVKMLQFGLKNLVESWQSLIFQHTFYFCDTHSTHIHNTHMLTHKHTYTHTHKQTHTHKHKQTHTHTLEKRNDKRNPYSEFRWWYPSYNKWTTKIFDKNVFFLYLCRLSKGYPAGIVCQMDRGPHG